MTHLSLFSGIDGIGIAAEWAGFETVGQCEIDPYCRRILRRHWPDVPQWEDIRGMTGEEVGKRCGTITLISGGFPCQPVSQAGKRGGTGDDRWLWPQMRRIIREVAPRWVLAENVPGLLSIKHGLVFESVLSDLETAGYEAVTLEIPAAGVDAPHLRRRVFVVAHAQGNGWEGPICSDAKNRKDASWPQWKSSSSLDTRLYIFEEFEERMGEPAVFRMDDGIPHRVDRLRALGNAIVPQQVYPILQAIAEVERHDNP